MRILLDFRWIWLKYQHFLWKISVLLCCHVTMLAKRVFLENPVESKAFVERNIRQIWKVTFLVIQIIIVYLGFSGFDGKKYQINTKMTINVQ